jgi:hypothetical protein
MLEQILQRGWRAISTYVIVINYRVIFMEKNMRKTLLGLLTSLLVSTISHAVDVRQATDATVNAMPADKTIKMIDGIVNDKANTSDWEAVVAARTIENTIKAALAEARKKAPVGSFNVLYFDTKKKVILDKTKSQDIAVSYSWDEMYNTPSEDFGAYWAGKLNFNEATNKKIIIDQSHSKSMLMIDGKLVYQGDSEAEVPFGFTKGIHLLEVRHFNNWHTTKFSVTLQPGSDTQVNDYKAQPFPVRRNFSVSASGGSQRPAKLDFDIGAIPEKYISNPPRIVLAGIYRTKSPNAEVIVALDKMPFPVVLMLSSVEPVKWLVKNPSGNEIVKVVNSPNTVVSLGSPENIPIETQEMPFFQSYKVGEIKCHCDDSPLYCSQKPVLLLINNIQQATNVPVYGYSIGYEESTIFVPKNIVDREIPQLSEGFRSYKKQKDQCSGSNLPNFDLMIDS